ncbi:hypothetical protein B0T20DRAFT_388725 [Sordaria brevicollis]|uniref:Uncharacterized protein n=1 Tax=Sordaria brevicollis TaxID=83679 RepID=A0AAE0PNC9_SORBR|nr:hypothetical protein B0T20DRAFT_388725 [Sordaria brevicollis]
MQINGNRIKDEVDWSRRVKCRGMGELAACSGTCFPCKCKPQLPRECRWEENGEAGGERESVQVGGRKAKELEWERAGETGGEREDGARLDLGHGGGEERGREVKMESPGSDGKMDGPTSVGAWGPAGAWRYSAWVVGGNLKVGRNWTRRVFHANIHFLVSASVLWKGTQNQKQEGKFENAKVTDLTVCVPEQPNVHSVSTIPLHESASNDLVVKEYQNWLPKHQQTARPGEESLGWHLARQERREKVWGAGRDSITPSDECYQHNVNRAPVFKWVKRLFPRNGVMLRITALLFPKHATDEAPPALCCLLWIPAEVAFGIVCSKLEGTPLKNQAAASWFTIDVEENLYGWKPGIDDPVRIDNITLKIWKLDRMNFQRSKHP